MGGTRQQRTVTLNGQVHADGSFHPGGADFAEMVPVREAWVDPGDVVALTVDGKLVKKTKASQGSVLGVVSTKPGYEGDLYKETARDNKVPLDVIGIVLLKATAANGPIRPGAAEVDLRGIARCSVSPFPPRALFLIPLPLASSVEEVRQGTRGNFSFLPSSVF